MTHGQKLRRGGGAEGRLEGGRVQEGGGERGEKNWDNLNSTINKIYFKNKCLLNCTSVSKYKDSNSFRISIFQIFYCGKIHVT